eukprot:GHVR01017250.1.p2 GENE.GHVR01017250.1~~GHVR01017250.1.p2  ORF type:complete len:102 (-),score=20.75 GHVR01017250.1:757-1062(-)
MPHAYGGGEFCCASENDEEGLILALNSTTCGGELLACQSLQSNSTGLPGIRCLHPKSSFIDENFPCNQDKCPGTHTQTHTHIHKPHPRKPTDTIMWQRCTQ